MSKLNILAGDFGLRSKWALDAGRSGEARRGARILAFFASVVGVCCSSVTTAENFAERCADPDVLVCVGFDSPADLEGAYGDISGVLPGFTAPEIDGTTKESGEGSIRFTIPSQSPANTSGTYFTNFSDDLSVQFGENSEFFVQWQQRFSSEFLSGDFVGGGGWKQFIVGTGDQPGKPYASCTAPDIVVQNIYHRGFAQMYNSCTGSESHGPYDSFDEPFNGDYKLQNGMPEPYCLYSQQPDSLFPPTGNCFGYEANQWMTFQVGVTTGPRVGNEFVDSHVRLWIARQGEPPELVIDWGPYNLTAGRPEDDERYGKVWLLPYNTDKDPAHEHATAYTWYDNLIVSRSRINDPDSPPLPRPPGALEAE